MTDEEECLLILSETESELKDVLQTELADVKRIDKELMDVEKRLSELRARVREESEKPYPDHEFIEDAYAEYLELCSRQINLMESLNISIDTIGLCEDEIY